MLNNRQKFQTRRTFLYENTSEASLISILNSHTEESELKVLSYVPRSILANQQHVLENNMEF